MNLSYIKKPEYYLQPLQVLLRRTTQRLKDKDCWHLPIHTFSGDYLDRTIKRTGLYDIALTELIWKLTIPVFYAFKRESQ